MRHVKVLILTCYLSTLRCFDVTQAETPLSTIKLFDSLNSSNQSSFMNFAAATGEMAISFSFAPPLAKTGEANVHPIFITQENGDTWTLWSRFSHKKYVLFQILFFSEVSDVLRCVILNALRGTVFLHFVWSLNSTKLI